MEKYYVCRVKGGGRKYIVHNGNCRKLPDSKNRKLLGSFSNCLDAIAEAKTRYSDVEGCKECCEV